MHVTVIIPFHRNLAQLARSLPAARRAVPDAELIIAADGAVENCRPLAAQHGARIIDVPGPAGPAVARNRAAAAATGDIIVFVDTDVVPAADSIGGMCELLSAHRDVAAVFGAYDLHPPEPNFMSQFKNLAHSYVHAVGSPNASTFWAGLGAVRTQAFRSVGGFDERFSRPSVEDIELGYRLTTAGFRIRLDPRFRGTHLKRWTFRSCIMTDLSARGIPWTQLLHRRTGMANDLNTTLELRLSVIAAFGVVVALLSAPFLPWASAVAAVSLAGLVWLNRAFYGWFYRQRGAWFATRVVPVHLVHHLCNGISFVTGTAIHMASRAGLRLPGAIPETPWTGQLASTAATPDRA